MPKQKQITPAVVRVCYVDTATGESYSVDAPIEVTPEGLVAWWMATEKKMADESGVQLEKNYKVECKALVTQGGISTFILAITGVTYFVEFMAHGTIYTKFN